MQALSLERNEELSFQGLLFWNVFVAEDRWLLENTTNFLRTMQKLP